MWNVELSFHEGGFRASALMPRHSARDPPVYLVIPPLSAPLNGSSVNGPVVYRLGVRWGLGGTRQV